MKEAPRGKDKIKACLAKPSGKPTGTKAASKGGKALNYKKRR